MSYESTVKIKPHVATNFNKDIYSCSRFMESVWGSTHHPVQDFAKYHVLPIQPRCSGSQDEELWSIGVRTSVRHTHLVWTHTHDSPFHAPCHHQFCLLLYKGIWSTSWSSKKLKRSLKNIPHIPHIPLHWVLCQKTEIQTCVCSPSLLLNASVWSSHLQKLFHRCCDLHRKKECGHFHECGEKTCESHTKLFYKVFF